MQIEIETGQANLYDSEISDEEIKFKNGKAEVSQSVGEKFVEEYDLIHEVETTKSYEVKKDG